MTNNIRKIIQDKELTITQVIERTGFSKSYVYDVINGTTVPSLINARKIAKVLGEELGTVFPEVNNNE